MTATTNVPVIIDAVRTPIGRYAGALSCVRPDDLAAHVIKALVERTGIDPVLIEDVIFGCANQAGEDNRNVARMASLLAGLPVDVPGQTVNRLCASGLQAAVAAQHAILAEEGEIFIAGGVESMSRAPYVMLKPEKAFERGEHSLYDTTLGWRFTNPALASMHYPYSMGETAENVAEQYQVSRAEQDEFAAESHQRAQAAVESGRFNDEIVAIEARMNDGSPAVVEQDETPRFGTTIERLAALPPAFRFDGSVTAGNSSGLSDGAAALLIASERAAAALGLQPKAKIVASAVVGVDPAFMGLGPIPATKKALLRAGLEIDEIDIVELNEAFAAQAVPCIRELGLDRAKVNPNGGAIALGHPLGATGARMLTTLVHEMARTEARHGLATLCVGVGQGLAMVLERP